MQLINTLVHFILTSAVGEYKVARNRLKVESSGKKKVSFSERPRDESVVEPIFWLKKF